MLGVKLLNAGDGWYVPPFMLYSQPETVLSVMFVAVEDANVGAAGAVCGAFVTVAVLGEVTLPLQFAAATTTLICCPMSA